MSTLTLDHANQIISAALSAAADQGFKPLAVLVLDAGGHAKAFARQDGASIGRFQIANGKAYGALSLGMGSRALMERAEQQAYFVAAATAAFGGALVPVPGGVLVKDGDEVIGAVGISGDTSDNDETAAVAGIEAAGFAAITG